MFFFAQKDPVPRQLLSNMVYSVSCMGCPTSYIGKTCRQISQRFEEHRQITPISIQPETHSRACSSTTKTEMTTAETSCELYYEWTSS
jgi:hypothetical protein